MKKLLLVYMAFIIMVLVGCTSKTDFDLGKLEAGKYTNGFFGFSITIDDSYTFLTQEEILNIRNSAIDEDIIEENIELDEQPVIYYLYALKYKYDKNNPYNPYIAVYSENLDFINKVIKTKEDYIKYNMEFATAIFNASGIEATSTNIDKLWYDDRQFANSILSIKSDDIIMKKELFTILRDNYAITVILGYDKQEDREEMMRFLDSIAIEKR